MLEGTQHLGKQILGELRRKSVWGQVKSKVSFAFWFVLKLGMVSVYTLAGFLSAQTIVLGLAHKLVI